MDPFRILELDRGASPEAVREAYRRLAKRWHPDRGGGAHATARMAEINVAYDLLRAEAAHRRPVGPAPRRPRSRPEQRPPGAWLDPAVRRALGDELLGVLEEREPVALVTPTTMWASPRAFLAVSDRRLLWLLDDAVAHRVRELRFHLVERVEVRVRRPRGRVARLRVRTLGGRRIVFADLRPATAAAVAQRVEAARTAA